MNVSGFINLRPNDPINDFAAIVLSVTQKSNSGGFEDDSTYLKNLVRDSKIMINNGNLRLKGLLAKQKIQTRIDDRVSKASFQLNELVIPIPSHINLDDLVFNIGVDNGN